ncbi:hypothetical protein JYU34_015013 [Plutella xylostella]|uniref:EGF-like domain-containing protein n=1 Tax=Plutella xylostella TaxID=51655 RepID=A0ABQ7Q656_PLUXY|nr:hypothetical protein JYU34_015013 [Plutella xylostella]
MCGTSCRAEGTARRARAAPARATRPGTEPASTWTSYVWYIVPGRGDGAACSCGPGARYSPGNRTCVDLDECEAPQPRWDGAACSCGPGARYSPGNRTCVDLDECKAPQPRCEHKCHNKEGRFSCSCEDGYTSDRFEYLCFAPDPEPLLFFATRHEIKYYKIKSRVLVTAVTGVKQAHGMTYDGTYLYWVEKAEGHQAVVRAKLDDVENTKQTLIALGLDDPGDISYEHSTNTIYITDAERGSVAACAADAAVCARLNTTAAHPKFLTLHARRGEMYWLDYLDRPVIMRANMDGSNAHVLTDDIKGSPTGLALDAANDRLYYVDKHIVSMRLDNKGSYIFLNDALGHPYSLAVFENSVYWSDWTSNTIQVADKVHPPATRRRVLLTLDEPVFGIHIYHPILLRHTPSGCSSLGCSDLCLLRGRGAACACHSPRALVTSTSCAAVSEDQLPEFLIVGGGAYFTMVRYNSLGNPEARAAALDIGRVHAMAYDNNKRTLYIYDGQRKTINYIGMNEFSRGVTRLLEHRGLDNVMDMGYDYVSKALYFVDAGRRTLEVISLVTSQRAVVHRFERAAPISLCVLSEHGLIMVAVIDHERNNEIHIDSMGLDGSGRSHVITTGLKGYHVRLRYSHVMDNVYISDEGTGAIYYIHPSGTGKEQYRMLSTSITSLAVSDTTVFWADRRTPRLFWSLIHETSPRVRRMTLCE